MEERQLELLNTSIYKIDLKENILTETPLSALGTDFYDYIRGSINDVSLANGGRKFELRSESTQVVSILTTIAKDQTIKLDKNIPDRLLREEIKVQAKIARMGREMNEGMLIVSIVEDRGIKKAILCKVEDLDYINKITLKRQSGYPITRKIFRSAQFIFDSSDKISDVLVHDLNSSGATYWWNEFLELNQLWDDIYNTKTAFEMIDTKVLSRLRKDFPADHTYLKNSTIRYFRTSQEFNIDEFIKNTFEGYQPAAGNKLDMEKLKKDIKELPNKWSFDERFDLKPTEITAKIKYAIKLTNDIDLVVKDEIDIEHTITPIIFEKKKYIRIRSDAGYDAFEKNKNKN
jgi:hypothetical protein